MASGAEKASEFETHRPRLFSLAYRMLGSAAEAEDAVQDAYLRWHAADRSAIATPAAWLTKVLTNLCVNRLTSARVQRERYIGPWIAEPVLTGADRDGSAPLGPLETAEQRESVSLGLLTLMERLTPAERAVFVLREAFGHGHREIAAVLDVAESSSRQLLRRARQRLAEDRKRFDPSRERWQEIVERFLAAANGGDLSELEKLLSADVVAYSDGGGKVTAARVPIIGRDKVARYLAGILRVGRKDYDLVEADVTAFGLQPPTEGRPRVVVATVEANGSPAVLALLNGYPAMVQQYEVSDGAVTAVRTVVNPDKLAYLAGQLERPREG